MTNFEFQKRLYSAI
jgi:hypothetical protein